MFESKHFEEADSKPHIPMWIIRLIFILTGCSHLWYWNTILNLTTTINNYFFPDDDNLSNILTIVFEVACSLAVLYGAWHGGLSEKLGMYSGCVVVVASILVPIVLYLPHSSLYPIWIILTGVLGATVGLQQANHYAVASSLPDGVLAAYVSSGEGVGGLLSYCLCLTTVNVADLHPHTCVWIQMTIGVFLGLIATIGPVVIYRQPHVLEHIAKQNKHLLNDNRGYLQLAMCAWYPLVIVFLAYFSSYIVFPNIGPFKWGSNYESQGNIVMGLSQLGVMLGRSAPNLEILLVPLYLCATTTLSKFVIAVTFVLAAKYQNNFYNSYGYQIIFLFVMSLFEGWMGTSAMVHAAIKGENAEERSKLGTLSVVCLCFGVSIGMLICPLIQKISDI